MVKDIVRVVVAPLAVVALAFSGLTVSSFAAEQAIAATGDRVIASAAAKTIDVQALKAAKPNKAAKAKKAFAGKYELVKMNQNGEITGAKDLKVLRAMGLNVTLNLKKNGKAVLTLFDEKMQGTWKASTTKRGKMKLQGQAVAMKKSGKKVTLAQKGSSLTFKKK